MVSQTTYFHKAQSPFPPGSKTLHGLISPQPSLIEQVRRKLALSLEELRRMEDEGGSHITPEQSEEMKKLSDAIDELDKLTIPDDEDPDTTSGSAKEK